MRNVGHCRYFRTVILLKMFVLWAGTMLGPSVASPLATIGWSRAGQLHHIYSYRSPSWEFKSVLKKMYFISPGLNDPIMWIIRAFHSDMFHHKD